MKLLLDTHLLLWAAGQPDQLSATARGLLNDLQNELFFSSASLWEVSIRHGLGRDDFRVDPRLLRRGLLDNGYRELPIRWLRNIPVRCEKSDTQLPLRCGAVTIIAGSRCKDKRGAYKSPTMLRVMERYN